MGEFHGTYSPIFHSSAKGANITICFSTDSLNHEIELEKTLRQKFLISKGKPCLTLFSHFKQSLPELIILFYIFCSEGVGVGGAYRLSRI